MNTTCADVMREIASGEVRSAAAEKHLAECPDCALFLRISTLEAEDSGYEEVPEALDAAILAEAGRQVARRRWKLWKIALPIAASFVLSFGIAFYSLMPAQNVPVSRMQQGVAQTSIFDYDDSLISLSCEVADSAALFSNVYEIANQGVQTI